jgi:choline transporter-like protein 2/4/5
LNPVALLSALVFMSTNFVSLWQMGEKIVQDLSNSWPYIVGGLVVAMLLCLVYIMLMRWFAGIMVWVSLLSVLALLSYCKYVG